MNMFVKSENIKSKKILATLLCLSMVTGQAQALGWDTVTSCWKAMSKDAKNLTTTIGLSLASAFILSMALKFFESNSKCDESCKGDTVALEKNKKNNKSINGLRAKIWKTFITSTACSIILSPFALNFKIFYDATILLSKLTAIVSLGASGSILYLKSKYPLIVNAINGNTNDSESIINDNKAEVNKKFLYVYSPLDVALMPISQDRTATIKLLLDHGAAEQLTKNHITTKEDQIKQIETKIENKNKKIESIKKEKQSLEEAKTLLGKKFREQEKQQEEKTKKEKDKLEK